MFANQRLRSDLVAEMQLVLSALTQNVYLIVRLRCVVNLSNNLCLIGRRRHIATPPSPIDVVVLALRIFVICVLWFNSESMSSEVISLGLQEVGRQILGSITVIEAKRGAECRCRDTPQCAFAYNVPPTWLRLVNCLVEEVVEQQVFKVGVFAIRSGNVLEEN